MLPTRKGRVLYKYILMLIKHFLKKIKEIPFLAEKTGYYRKKYVVSTLALSFKYLYIYRTIKWRL